MFVAARKYTKERSRRFVSNSAEWKQRQKNDPYVKMAAQMNLRSRSSIKLLEIHNQFKLFGKKDLVVDLGASPGGWSLVARKFLDVGQGGRICAVDLLEMEPVDGCDFFIGDFRRKDVKDRLISACNGRQPDIILSDMLHNTTGVHSVDHHRSIDLCFEVLDFSKQMLRWVVPVFA